MHGMNGLKVLILNLIENMAVATLKLQDQFKKSILSLTDAWRMSFRKIPILQLLVIFIMLKHGNL